MGPITKTRKSLLDLYLAMANMDLTLRIDMSAPLTGESFEDDN